MMPWRQFEVVFTWITLKAEKQCKGWKEGKHKDECIWLSVLPPDCEYMYLKYSWLSTAPG